MGLTVVLWGFLMLTTIANGAYDPLRTLKDTNGMNQGASTFARFRALQQLLRQAWNDQYVLCRRDLARVL